MTETLPANAIGLDVPRRDGAAKVRGAATYADDRPVLDPAYLHPLQATIARGTITGLDTGPAEALGGVLAVVTHLNAPRLDPAGDAELLILQSSGIAFRGQLIGAVVAETPEIARHAAELVRVTYIEEAHDADFWADHHDAASLESTQNAVSEVGHSEIEQALAAAPILVDQTYSTPAEHHNPIEPHTTVARWEADDLSTEVALTLHESTQGVHTIREALAELFELPVSSIRVVAPYVGGGFGSKLFLHAPTVLAVLAARLVPGRWVKLALTRQQMFAVTGYRPPTSQRVRLAASKDGTLAALAVDVIEQTARLKDYAEGSDAPARMLYAAPKRRTTSRLVALDVAVPTFMRGPGKTPGMFALEVAMDELAVATGVDPVALRTRNDTQLDPESGQVFASRHLVECLEEGAREFGWHDRNPTPRARLEHGWLVGTGVASATYPDWRDSGNAATICFAEGRYTVQIGAVDIGTGSWTVLTQIAADALGCPLESVRVQIGDTEYPRASFAGGSMGTTSWGAAVLAAAQAFSQQHGEQPKPGAETSAAAPGPTDDPRSCHSFGAQFAEVRVHADTGEIRVSRLLGVFSVGRVMNPRTVRSQFLGGMTMGIGMALHERSVLDPRFGAVVNHDLAEYHLPTSADVEEVEARWIEDRDSHAGALGARGAGEIGVIGVAPAIVNACYHATGVRVRQLPVTLDAFLT